MRTELLLGGDLHGTGLLVAFEHADLKEGNAVGKAHETMDRLMDSHTAEMMCLRHDGTRQDNEPLHLIVVVESPYDACSFHACRKT